MNRKEYALLNARGIKMKRVIISGGNFVNKGAEAMLYVTANECFTRFDGCICSVQLAEGFFEIRSLEDLNRLANSSVYKCFGPVLHNHHSRLFPIGELHSLKVCKW